MMKSFDVRISDKQLNDLYHRLDNTRWPSTEMDDANWTYGVPLNYLKSLCDYWRHQFDWRKQEMQLNRYSHFQIELDNQRLHFIHQPSHHKSARPLIITHGWPGSVVEFLKIIDPLTDPVAHGGSEEDAFHVICPSLPGFGFSSKPTEAGIDPRKVAALQIQLMEALGYSGYIAQGGDWGSMISTEMARQAPDQCAGLHLNMVVALPPSENAMEGVSPQEAQSMQTTESFTKEGMGYYHIQSTKPQTLSYGLTDSPVGQAAWIVEKFRDWSDCDGDIEKSYSRDELLTNISLYWFTATAGSSARIYYETIHNEQNMERVEVPTGCALFPKELMKAPRKWADQAYNVVHWQKMPRGGHFAAMEEPGLLVEDLRKFNRVLRKL